MPANRGPGSKTEFQLRGIATKQELVGKRRPIEIATRYASPARLALRYIRSQAGGCCGRAAACGIVVLL